MRDFLSSIIKEIPSSGIRKFFDIAAERKDCLSLGVGEPDFVTDQRFRQAAIDSIVDGKTQYTANKGLLELRKEIAIYLKNRFEMDYDPLSEIVITVGASEAIDISLKAVIDSGDEVLIPDPSFVSYAPTVKLAHGVPVYVPTYEKDDFKLTPENLEKCITPKSKILIFPFPNNPTGAIMGREDIAKLIPIIEKYDLLVLADEIYSELTYGGSHVSIGSFPNMKQRTITINGFSKAFAMTGWRLGYLAAPKYLTDAIVKIHQYLIMSAPTNSQYAALSALTESKLDDFAAITYMRDEYDKRRKFLVKSLNDIGLSTFEPKGAFYVFPCVKSTGLDGDAFANRLLDAENMAVVPGAPFGDLGKDYVRISYAYSMEKLEDAVKRIARFVNSLKK